MSSYHSSHFLSAQVQQQKKRTFPQNCCHPFALFRVLDSNRQSPYKIFTWHCSTFLMCSQKCLAEKKKKNHKGKKYQKNLLKNPILFSIVPLQKIMPLYCIIGNASRYPLYSSLTLNCQEFLIAFLIMMNSIFKSLYFY